jgi:RNA polymerase sigma-70 factor (ECF subfamily)
MILAARAGPTPESRVALAGLCEAYWYPLYAFNRRRGSDREEASDLTQGFFEQFLEKRTLQDLRPGEGRFRSFLLSSLKHFVSHEREREAARKRGGGSRLVSFDSGEAEERYDREPRDDRTPERAYERAWAQTVLDRVFRRLEGEFEAAGKERLFAALAPSLTGREAARPHREVADALGISEDAVKMSLLRLRKRFGRLLREEIAQTVEREDQVDDELRFLLSAVGR